MAASGLPSKSNSWMTKKKILALFSLFILGSCALAYHLSDTSEPTNVSAAPYKALENNAAKRSTQQLSAPVDIPGKSTAARRVQQKHLTGYTWNPDNPGIASSADDAAWLDKHGFPGPDVEADLRTIHIDELKRLAESGSAAAASVFAYRRAEQGAPKTEVISLLGRSAANGSVYALKTAGDIHTMVDGYRDPVMASAYYGMQARSGDHAGFAQKYLISGQLTDDQRFKSQLLEELMWRNLGLTKSDQSTESSRPGFDRILNSALTPTNNQDD